jgi:TPR repeat protein
LIHAESFSVKSKRIVISVIGVLLTTILTGCDAIKFGATVPKCDDPEALKLTADLIRSTEWRDPLFGFPVDRVKRLALSSSEMILTEGVDKELGKASCVASFVFSDPAEALSTETCKYSSGTAYSLQHDSTGQLVSTATDIGRFSCVKFTQQEVDARTSRLTDPAEQVARARRFLDGDGVVRDYAEAAKWFRKAADQGDATAQVQLAALYVEGRGVAQNHAEAATWLRKAADQSDATAQVQLAALYVAGKGVTQNDAEAAMWLRKAADQGDTVAQNELAVFFINGRGVAQSYTEAAKWFRRAADQGDAVAMGNLGLLYAGGSGVPQGFAEAARLYRASTDAGETKFLDNLGLLYAHGRGVPRDIESARRFWMKVSYEEVRAVYYLGESFYAGDEFGDAVDLERAKIYWERVLSVATPTDQAYRHALAGLNCIKQSAPSAQCQPLRCSIEGRQDCPDL